MKRPVLLFVSLLLVSLVSLAQPVYESKGRSGTREFSDRPSAGAHSVDMKPLVIVEPVAPAASPSTAPSPAQAEPAVPDEKKQAKPYRSFSIVFPEADGTVAINTATFEIRVAIDPPLQLSKGHAFVFRIDGRAVPGRYTSTESMLPPEFFGDSIPAGAQAHVIEASVVDEGGRVISKAAPVNFYTRFFNRLQNPHFKPEPVPQPVPHRNSHKPHAQHAPNAPDEFAPKPVTGGSGSEAVRFPAAVQVANPRRADDGKTQPWLK